MIPEKVIAVTSASLGMKKNHTYENQFGRYEYSDIPVSAFSEGLCYIEEGEYAVKIASKEKAICDSLYKWRTVRSITQLRELLFLDKRIDETEFSGCDFDQMKRLAKLYRRTNLQLLVQLIGKEYENG
jgi:hypothetical protein